MRRCKNCMQVYSESYDCCPNCGCTEFSVKATERKDRQPQQPQKNPDKKLLVILMVACLAVALIAVIALVISSFSDNAEAEEETAATTDFSQQEFATTDGSFEQNTIAFPEYEEYVPEETYTTEPESETTKKVASKNMRVLPDVSDCSYAEAEQVLKKIRFSVKKEIVKNTDPSKTGKVKEAKGLKFGENYPEGTTITLLVYGEATATTASAANTAWKQAYINTIKAATGVSVSFELGYVDDDNIPELFVATDKSHAAGVTVYTYHNGKVVKLCDLGSYGEACYVERTGYICGYYMGFGALETDVYKLENGKATQVFASVDESNVDETLLDGKKRAYTINGKTVTQKDLINYYNIYFGKNLWNEDEQVNSSEIKSAPDIAASEANLKKYITDFNG